MVRHKAFELHWLLLWAGDCFLLLFLMILLIEASLLPVCRAATLPTGLISDSRWGSVPCAPFSKPSVAPHPMPPSHAALRGYHSLALRHHLCVQPHRTVCPISFLLFWATPPPPVPAQPHWSCSVLIPVVPACSLAALVAAWMERWNVFCLSLPGSPWVTMGLSRIRKRTFGLRRWRTWRRAASPGSFANLR